MFRASPKFKPKTSQDVGGFTEKLAKLQVLNKNEKSTVIFLLRRKLPPKEPS